MSSKRLGATAVVQGDKGVGIITDGDIRRMIEKTKDLTNVKAIDIMGHNPVSLQLGCLHATVPEKEVQLSSNLVERNKSTNNRHLE